MIMAGHECYHCKQWVEKGEEHDCWTTTEAALTRDLSEDLRDAWERLREAATDLGEQRIYASHKSIMFSRKSCYFFVRPKRHYLEVVVFLGREVQSPLVHKVLDASKIKRAHVVRIQHRDQVEAPITDWLREAYEFVESTRNAKDTKHPTAVKTTAGGRAAGKTVPKLSGKKAAKAAGRRRAAKRPARSSRAERSGAPRRSRR